MRGSDLIVRAAGAMAGIFFRIERAGEPLPGGPLLLVANHPNSLLDPLVLFRAAGRPTRPLAKAPLFRHPLVGPMLRALGGLPVYRRQDDASQMHRNEDTFRRAIGALQAGEAVQIYPEGITHSAPALAPLRTGAARIALAAESERDWRLGLRIAPVGLTYSRKTLFRGRVLVFAGEPIEVAPFRAHFEQDEQEAVRQLTETVADRLRRLVLETTSPEDVLLIETAERLYVRGKGATGWRTRDELEQRLPRLRRFAEGVAWLRTHDTATFGRLERAVRRHARRLERLGVTEADVPPAYHASGVARYTFRRGAPLLLGLVPACAGMLIWWPTYFAPRTVVRLTRPEFEAIATHKLGAGCLTAILVLAVLVTAAGLTAGAWAALAAAIAAPVLGIVAVWWLDRWRALREDARLWWALRGRGRGADRIAAERDRLILAIDQVLGRMETAGDDGQPGV